MIERSILFNAEMVRSVLEDRKTQTRRILNGTGLAKLRTDGTIDESYRPYGHIGDRLWVRESWTSGYQDGGWGTIFREDGSFSLGPRQHERGPHFHAKEIGPHVRWRPSIHMPRWASRITLEITDVRVQRLQDITEEEAQAEGVSPQIVTEQDIQDTMNGKSDSIIKRLAQILGPGEFTAKFKFGELWDSIYGEGAWRSNPWVWVVSFKMVKP